MFASSLLRGSVVGPAPAMRACSTRFAFKPAFRPATVPVRTLTQPQRGALQVVAAEPEKAKVLKRIPSPVKRALLSAQRRMYNRQRKSACATRIKKVLLAATELFTKLPKSEEEVKPLESLISIAYKEIDKARVKGILHRNTAARKKARLARYKRKVLILAGLFTPDASHRDYAMYKRTVAKDTA